MFVHLDVGQQARVALEICLSLPSHFAQQLDLNQVLLCISGATYP